jgi:hypothetical protein
MDLDLSWSAATLTTDDYNQKGHMTERNVSYASGNKGEDLYTIQADWLIQVKSFNKQK